MQCPYCECRLEYKALRKHILDQEHVEKNKASVAVRLVKIYLTCDVAFTCPDVTCKWISNTRQLFKQHLERKHKLANDVISAYCKQLNTYRITKGDIYQTIRSLTPIRIQTITQNTSLTNNIMPKNDQINHQHHIANHKLQSKHSRVPNVSPADECVTPKVQKPNSVCHTKIREEVDVFAIDSHGTDSGTDDDNDGDVSEDEYFAKEFVNRPRISVGVSKMESIFCEIWGIDDQRPCTETKTLLKQYQKYLMSDMCSKKHAEKEMVIILKIFQCCNCLVTLSPLVDINEFAKGFQQLFRKKSNGELKKQSSMKTYTVYIHNLCQYMITFQSHDTYNVCLADLLSFRDRLNLLIKNYLKGIQVSARYNEIYESEWIHTYLTPENVHKFRESAFHRHAVELLCLWETSGDDMTLTRTDYALMRDILIHHMIFGSASREGVLIELSLEEFLSGEIILGNGQEFFQVALCRHKTFRSNGIAYLNFNTSIYKWIVTFISKIRPRVPLPPGRTSSSETHILLPWTRRDPGPDKVVKMSSGAISKRLRAMFVKSHVLPVSVASFNCTIIRKATSTALHLKMPGHDEIIANALCHHVNTARRYYRRPDNSRNSIRAQYAISSHWSSAGNTTTDAYHHQQTNAKTHRNDQRLMDIRSNNLTLPLPKQYSNNMIVPLSKKPNLPEFLQPERNGKLTDTQQEIIFQEYWDKGFISTAGIRSQMVTRSETDVTFQQIRRKIAAWKIKAKGMSSV